MARMDRTDALERLAGAELAYLATVTPEQRPHVVPVTFAVVEDRVFTMVDHKPKTTRELQRLANIRANPAASLLADHYSEDWGDLWWVRVDGTASIHDSGAVWVTAREALGSKYRQYEERLPDGSAICLTIETIRFWGSTV